MEQREAIELLVNQLREELDCYPSVREMEIYKESIRLYLALIDYKERYF